MPSAFIAQKTLDRLYASKNLHFAADRDECDAALADIAHRGLERYVASRKPWRHPFDREGRWLKSEDCESSILSKALFFDLFSLMEKEGFVDGPYLGRSFGHRRQGAAEYGDGLLFHFDMMSNARARNASGKTISKWRIGSMAESKGAKLAFGARSHVLGNLTPVPWWIERCRTAKATDMNLQLFHNDVAEWWDVLLCYLQWRMGEFAGEGRPPKGCARKPTFAEYITLTCQFFYVDNQTGDKALFDRLARGDISAKGFCDEVEATGGWLEHVGMWAKDLLDRKDELRIVSLARSGDSNAGFLELPEALRAMGESARNGTVFKQGFWVPDGLALPACASWDKGQVEATGRLIDSLIEVRGRCITGLLSECKG